MLYGKHSWLQKIAATEEYKRISERTAKERAVEVSGASELTREALAAVMFSESGGNMVYVCSDDTRAKAAWADLTEMLGEDSVLYFPSQEVIPYTVFSQSGEVQGKRLEVLGRLASKGKYIVVAPVESIFRSLIPLRVFRDHAFSLKKGSGFPPDDLFHRLVSAGYERTERVENPGQFAVRGGLVDVFSPAHDMPFRLDFFDTEIDSIRFFDSGTQVSTEKSEEVHIYPAHEFVLDEKDRENFLHRINNVYEKHIGKLSRFGKKETLEKFRFKFSGLGERLAESGYFPGIELLQPFFYEEKAGLFDYAGEDSSLVFDDFVRTGEKSAFLEEDRNRSYADLLAGGEVIPGQEDFYFSYDEFLAGVSERPQVRFSFFSRSASRKDTVRIGEKPLPLFYGDSAVLCKGVADLVGEGMQVIVCPGSESRTEKIAAELRDCGIAPAKRADGKVVLREGALNSGLVWPAAGVAVLTGGEIFKKSVSRVSRNIFRGQGRKITSADEITPGDYVVHESYGIGRYLGIKTLKVEETEKDYLAVQYRGGDKVYVPGSRMDILQKYTSVPGKKITLNKLGGSEWQRAKSRVRKAVQDMAEELLALYAARRNAPGFAFPPDDVWQQDFDDAFPFRETPDQLKAIVDAKSDMEKPFPMDRLICGDVGFGKTEVAMRLIFKAVTAGKQAAVLVPTTVLAQQHYETFMKRFGDFPVNTEVLSRFRSRKEQNETVKRVKSGETDIIIGTHRLLSKDVEFHDLGLLVVDEEQRFGVSHKEKIKKLKKNVDVVTLTATPIPRTLYMSLTGIRDLSVIETAPENRFPIQTYVVEYDRRLIREAVLREKERGGQVYYVHNRVEDIESVAARLGELVPEVSIGIAHGQMGEKELESVMLDFMEGKTELLLCTSIVESGLDIANANTMIVDNADFMGLSQLYQLRGRIGRTNRVAYAYLMYDGEKVLSADAEKRLIAVKQFTELGSGYKIALRDLEIRGAGNILGSEQSGHAASVGFEMYSQMLEEAVTGLRGEKTEETGTTEVEINVSAFIPDDYIRDGTEKLGFYRRIAMQKDYDSVDEVMRELRDRFGVLPESAVNLFDIAKLRLSASAAGFISVKEKGDTVQMDFREGAGITGEKLVNYAALYPGKIRYYTSGTGGVKIHTGNMTPGQKLRFLVRAAENAKQILS